MIIKISAVAVSGIMDSIRASGFPKGNDNISFGRAETLGTCKSGTGHDCYLKGIVVQADVDAPQYWWLQFQRYHFADIVSSESKMHMIMDMDIRQKCNEYVSDVVIKELNRLIVDHKDNPNPENFHRIVSNVPMGMMLKARIVTNYLQLKTMYLQRHSHKLEEWKTFCRWMEKLPEFTKLTGKGTPDDSK